MTSHLLMSKPAGFKLPSGRLLPPVGFGTWQLGDEDAERATKQALQCGYRLIDTARIYGNEQSVGRAIRSSGIQRDDIIVTTKLWNDDLGFESALLACETSREKLGLEYIDLYLIHWPANEGRHEAWRALQELQQNGRVRDIGVSNYSIEQLQELMGRSDVVPAVNQVEFHLFNYIQQKPLIDFCQEHGIVVEAYSPLARARRMDNLTLEEIANNHQKSVAQIMLRWCVQHDTVPLPKSSSAGRIEDNIEIFDFELSRVEMETLDGLSL